MAEFIKKWKRYFTFAALLSCFVNILQLIFPFYMFTIYRNIVISYSTVSLANITTIAVFAIMVWGVQLCPIPAAGHGGQKNVSGHAACYFQRHDQRG